MSVRLGDDEIAELRSAAELAGLRLSGYIAEAALAAARNTRPPMHDPLRDCLMEVLSAETQLRRVGGNLNQAVAALHATGTAPAWLEHALGATMRVVARVDETIDALGRHIDRADRRRQRDRRPPST
uniref:plasmid mobilization protein n=1 Tax=Frankia torreyi TaxID=1856 RepID=UPI000FF8B2C9